MAVEKEEIGGMWMGEALGSPVCRIEVRRDCWRGMIVGQSAVMGRCGGVVLMIGRGSSHQLKRSQTTESGDCMELGIAGSGWSIVDGVGDGVKAVDNCVGWCDS